MKNTIMKYLRHVILLLLVSVIIFTCKKNEGIDEYPHANALNYLVHDYTRSYILHVPPTYSKNTDMPLVVVMHGYTSTAKEMEEWTHMSDKADKEGFIVAYPNGLPYPWDENNPQSWNCGGLWEEWTAGTDDVGFINEMIEKISVYYNIDPNRIFITGHSNGARMTYRLGFELSAKIAAIAPVSGQMVYESKEIPKYPVSLLHLHALDDNTVYYYGQHNPNETMYESVDSILTRWSSYYSCKSVPDTIQKENNWLVKNWSCNDKDINIVLYVMQRGAHQWFTIENSGVAANDIIWEFFKSHPKKNTPESILIKGQY
jgi:polyhydroxybutyrate depolymerase